MMRKFYSYFIVSVLSLGLFSPIHGQSPLSSSTLKAILQSCSPNSSEYTISTLSGGYSGANIYKLTTPQSSFVIRQLSSHASTSDVTRLIDLSKLAGKSGASPKLCFSSHTQKIIVTDFARGHVTDIQNLTDDHLRQLATTLKEFHQVSMPSYVSDPTARFQHFIKKIPTHKQPIHFQKLITFVDQFVELRKHYQSLGFIHSDLHAMNILNEENQFWLIDLEDSGKGDIYFDLGQLIKNFLLNDHQRNLFITHYLGTVTPQQSQYIYLNTQLAHALYASWGIQQGSEVLHSTAQINHVLQNLSHIDVDQFLMDVHSGALALNAPEDKLKYGLINLRLFLKEWDSGTIQQAMTALSTTEDICS